MRNIFWGRGGAAACEAKPGGTASAIEDGCKGRAVWQAAAADCDGAFWFERDASKSLNFRNDRTALKLLSS